jgi:hypothetical protein
MIAQLWGSMMRLMHPPQASMDDLALIEALDRNTAATVELTEKAANIDRALSNIQEAAGGLFA